MKQRDEIVATEKYEGGEGGETGLVANMSNGKTGDHCKVSLSVSDWALKMSSD
jgi:hypothetical protein